MKQIDLWMDIRSCSKSCSRPAKDRPSIVRYATDYVLFLAAELSKRRVGRAQGELYLPPPHERDEIRRDAASEPEIFATGVLPGSEHAHRHSWTTFVYHRAFAKGLILSIQFEFPALFGRAGGESGTLSQHTSFRSEDAARNRQLILGRDLPLPAARGRTMHSLPSE
jgi:hypothetical protein